MKPVLTSFKKGLEASDLFGQGVGIRYNQRQFHKTKIGGFATIVIWGLIIYQSYSIIKELVYQENPTVIQQTNYVYQQEPFKITPKSFVIAIGLQDKQYKHFYGEGVYVLKAFQNIIIRNESNVKGVEDSSSNKQYEIKVERCTQNHFQIEESKNYFMHLPYSEMHCISLTQSPPYIEGEFSAERYASLELQFLRCSGSDCKDQAEIDELLIRPTLAVYISDTFINLKKKYNPFQSTGKNLFWTTGPTMEKDIFLSLISSKIESDYSIIGQTTDIQQTVVYSSDREITLPSTTDQLFRFTLVFEKNKEILYHRKYIKAGNAFSQVGGFFNFLVTFGCLFLRRFSQNDLNHQLVNEVFDIRDDRSYQKEFEEDDEHKFQGIVLAKSNPKSPLQKNRNDISPKNNIETPNFKTNRQKKQSQFFENESVHIQNDRKKPEIKQIKFNLWKYLWNVWRCWKCCESTESNLINYATNRIFDHIDLFNVIKKLIEVDKLKQLLLNEDQIKLFEYLPKPILFMADYQQNRGINSSIEIPAQRGSVFKLPNKEADKKVSFDILKKSYQNIIKQRQKSVLDLKIINMLDPVIKNKILSDENQSQMQASLIPPLLTITNSIFKPKSHINNEFNEEYEDSISRIDDLNDIFKPREIKSSQMKSLNTLKRNTIKLKQLNSLCESTNGVDESKSHINS